MKPPRQYFRAGVGAIIADRRGRVLVFERRDIPGAWQFPQGGLEAGEEPIDAAFREVREETGIAGGSLELLGRCPDLLAYELPPAARSMKTGRGQVQYWFLFRLKRPAARVRLPAGSEFRAIDTVPFDTAVARVVAFKKSVYRNLQLHFAQMTSGEPLAAPQATQKFRPEGRSRR